VILLDKRNWVIDADDDLIYDCTHSQVLEMACWWMSLINIHSTLSRDLPNPHWRNILLAEFRVLRSLKSKI
jgi:hypothetical protein